MTKDKEEVWHPTDIGCHKSDYECKHEWYMEYIVEQRQCATAVPPRKWRCKKCLATRYTYN